MTLNPHTEEFHKEVQTKEIERVRREIRKLPASVRKLIDKGEKIIDGAVDFQNLQGVDVNVFNLEEDVPGDAMKYLAMLYAASGFHRVSIGCSCFSSNDAHRVKYPNKISFRTKR